MKKTFKLASNLYALLITSACFIAMPSYGTAPPPTDTPPKTDPTDDEEPAVTNLGKPAVKQTMQTIQEGEQTEIKVTNGLGTYIVKPNERVGTSLPGDAQSNSNNPVQWIIKSWGGNKSTNPTDDSPPILQPNPDPSPPTTK